MGRATSCVPPTTPTRAPVRYSSCTFSAKTVRRSDWRGRTIQLSRRDTEVLALLSSHPAGTTAKSSTCRSCMAIEASLPPPASRYPGCARRWAAGSIGVTPSRDGRRLRLCPRAELLDRGDVRGAAEQSRPLLPHSDAPGIVRDREALEELAATRSDDDGRSRGAVGVGTMPDRATTTFQHGSSCSAQLEFRDPRRSFAAAQVQALRSAAYAIT